MSSAPTPVLVFIVNVGMSLKPQIPFINLLTPTIAPEPGETIGI